MIGKIISEKMREYQPADGLEQENVLAELLQHYVLTGLSRARFFARAGFHGGTCLHICYGMNRFSEDLDFILKEPDRDFSWVPYLNRIVDDCRDEGIKFSVQEKSSPDSAVKKAFLKTEPFGEIPELNLPFPCHPGRKIRIKLEADSNPPAGSSFESRYIDFPLLTAVTTQALESGFATKSHALLCRKYVKGRDWYDFLWYVSKKIYPNLPLLGNALDQQGPWVNLNVRPTGDWYLATMRKRIETIDWRRATEDVHRFIPARERESLDLWGPDLFLQYLARLTDFWR